MANRTKRFEIRLSEDEWNVLHQKAQECDMTPTQYMRILMWCVRPGKLPTKYDNQLLKELVETRRILQKQLDKKENQNTEEINVAIEKIDAVGEELLERIRNPFEKIESLSLKYLMDHDFKI